MKSTWLDHLINFVSVIVGVSLAFLISNRAEENRALKDRDYYIESIINELNDDIYTYQDYQIPDNEYQLYCIDRVLQQLSESESSDSLSYFLDKAFSVNNYFPSNTTFESMQNTGKMDLIDNFEIRGDLLMYSMESWEARFRGEAQLDFYMDRFITWVLENPKYSSGLEGIAENQEFLLLLSLYRSFVSNKVEKYKDILSSAEVLKEKMETL